MSSQYLKSVRFINQNQLIAVTQWGNASWSTMKDAFNNTPNLQILATDIPDLMFCISLENMFSGCTSVSNIPNIESWNTSNIGNMASTFENATSFNQDLGGWNTSNVNSFAYMFSSATSFNQDISNWDVSNAVDMNNMFSHAEAYNHDLGNWILNPNVILNDMLNFCGLDCDNYSQTLTGWQQNNPTVYNKTLGAIPLGHNTDAQTVKTILNNQQGWNIQDAGIGLCHAFETIWDLSLPGASNSSISFVANYVPTPSGSFEWESIPAGYSGSGNWNSLSPIKVVGGLPPSGIIKLKMSSQYLKSVRFINQNQLIAVTQWGNASWSTMKDAFNNTPNLQILATDIPDLMFCISLENMFSGCTSVSNIPNIESWNTSNIGNMASTFENATSFNQDLGSWALHPSANMDFMLSNSGLDCFNYASTLAGWAANNPTITNRTLGATGLNFAQFGNQARNTLINSRGWTITDAGQTNCGEFVTYWTMSQPGSHPNQFNFNVGFTDSLQYTWIHVGGNTSGSGYFTNQGAQTLSGIPTNADVRLVLRPQNLEHFSINNGPDRKRLYYVERWGNAVWKNMEGMFYGCESLEQNTSIGFPNTSYVTSMKNMFRDCINMIETGNPWFWDVSSVTNMESMFHNCPNFNEEINGWNVGSVTNMKSMFEGATLFDWDLSFWNVGNVTNFNSMFKGASSFNSWLNDWQTDNATDMAEMFHGATQFEYDLDNWQTYNVTSMKNMFRGASQFQGDISTWLTDNVTDMSGMFYGASLFNSNISNWNTAQVTNMANMFRNASNFDQELNAWIVEQVTNFSAMFMNASIFKRTLHNWNTTNGQYFDNMFNGASIFDGEVNTWTMLNAITTSGMFANAQEFNREIGAWSFPLVQDMSSMFQNATTFNRDLSNWSFPNANNMTGIFSGATQFNQDLSSWNVSNVQQLTSMFDGATSFNQNLGNWQYSSSVDLNSMLNNSGLDCNNYGATLSGWLANNASLQSINLGANNLNYGVLGEIARNILVNSQGWNIAGDNFVSTNPYVLNDGETFAAQLGCYGEFTRDDDPNERLILLDPNGNALDMNTVSVLATNNFLTPSDPEIVPIQTGGSGYYEITDGVNTFRVGKRMFKIEAPGNFTANGGVVVRLYYDQDDFNGMVNDTPPNGNIANYGWFKSATSDFQSTVDQMNASSPQMPLAVSLIPVYGNENGVEYVEFLVENFSVFGMYAQTIDAPLPVTLTAFNANCQGETIQLNWSTASEFNASHYVIQNSRDGSVWTDLAEVNAAGTTNQSTNYSFETKNFGGLSYFRLVQVDLDGATEIFGPVSANCELENSSMTVYPNPTAENFTVLIQTTAAFENATLELIDNTGRVVSSKTLTIEAGSTTIPFESEKLQAGVYVIRMRGEGEKFKPVQVVRM